MYYICILSLKLTGKEMPLPSAKQSISIFHPNPALAWPPSKHDMGIYTSSPFYIFACKYFCLFVYVCVYVCVCVCVCVFERESV